MASHGVNNDARFNVYLTQSVSEALKNEANTLGVSVSSMIRIIIINYLKNKDKQSCL